MELEGRENSTSVVLVEVKKKKDVQFCENTRSVMEANFMAKLDTTPQKALLQSQRQQLLVSPKDLPTVPAWKKVRGPPKSLKKDEEKEPVRSVLVQLLKIGNSGGDNEVAKLSTEKTAGAAQETLSILFRFPRLFNTILGGWFDIKDMCEFFDKLQVFYNPRNLTLLETLTVVNNTGREIVAAEENYLFVDSLDDIEVLIDFHFTESRILGELNTTARIEPTDWLSPHRHPPIATLPADNLQSLSLRLSRGRHCYRIFLETPLAASLTLFVPYANRERTTFVLGPMEICLQEAARAPLQKVHNGRQLIGKFCDIARGFIDAVEKNESTADCYLNSRDSFATFSEKIFLQKSVGTLQRVIRQNIARLISKHSANKVLTEISDAKFGWKVMVLDPEDELQVDNIRDREISPDIQRTVRGLKYLLDCLNEATDSEKVTLLQSIQRQLGCPYLPSDANFFTLRMQAGNFSEVSVKSVGCIWCAPANYVQSDSRKQCLSPIFHQKIHVPEGSARIRFHIESDEGVAQVTAIDNDSVAYVLSEDSVNSNSRWRFSCLYEGWREINFSNVHSTFAFWEANGVLEADEDGLLCRFSLDVMLRQVVSVILNISGSTTPARLILRSKDGNELANAHEESGGMHVMPGLLLGPDSKLEDGGYTMKCKFLSASLENQEGAESSTSSERSHNQDECKELSIETKTDTGCGYILEAYVKGSELHLAEEEVSMMAAIKKARMNEMRVDYEEKSCAGTSDPDLHKAKARGGPVKKVLAKEHQTLPSWTCRVYFDALNPESVSLKPYGLTPAELRAAKRSWLGENPSLRLEEAQMLRQAYILTENESDLIKTVSLAADGTGKADFCIPEVDEDENAELVELLSCTYTEEHQNALKASPDTNGTSLMHCNEENIQKEIWGLVHLAEENQVERFLEKNFIISRKMEMRKLLTRG
ncbi:unnamed protein product [Hydatigera taeniaeformis]|uniref:DHC_N2 domain-containing protein n=1 Tax=Hydatigena taeniaeformis TaxID=6205 RepID=A0A0R3X0E5_HYDTA|nr:unnamed protein product [Hydatigera taeniaeformis]